MTLHFFAIIFFFVLNMLFVLAEFALVKAQASRLEVMATDGNKGARLVLSMLQRLDTYLSAIQIGVTMGTLGLGWAAEQPLSQLFSGIISWPDSIRYLSHSLNSGISFCVVIYFQIVFCELVPRSIAIQQAERLAVWISYPLELYYQAFRLPIHLMAKSARIVMALIGVRPAGEHKEVFTEDEVRVLLGMSQEKGLMPLDRLLIIENLFDFVDLKVRDTMIPRERVAFLSTAKTWDENAATIRSNHFSRYPLGNPDLDNIAGFVHLKDLAMQGAGIPDLPGVARPLISVEDSQPLQPLLKTMAAQGKHMMIVKRTGKTVGLITLEDVIEELIGEILDEFDAPNAWSFNKLLNTEAIDLGLQSPTPQQTIQVLAGRLKLLNPSLDLKSVEKLVMARENQLPTAIGQGVALPHARLPDLDRPLVAIGRTDGSVAFSAPDKKPVQLVFLVLTPASSPLDQLRIIARIAMLAHNETLLKQMMRAQTPAQFLDTIRTSEAILAG